VTRLILLPRVPDLFVTSLMQATGHKMVVLMVVFLRPSATVFVTHGARNQVESFHVSYFYYSIPVDRAHEISLLWVSFKLTHPQSQGFTAKKMFAAVPFQFAACL